MKKSILFLIIVILCTQLFSCNGNHLPSNSDDFSKDFVNSFFDQYHVIDPQLAYATASPWDVELKIKGSSDRGRLYLALIDNVDKAQFIAGIERSDFYMGPSAYHIYVYQTADAPVPMRDWTIKSIKILETTPLTDSYEDVVLRSEKYSGSILESSVVLHTYEMNNDQDFLDMIKRSYSAPVTTLEQNPLLIRKTDENQPNYLRYYSLLIEFNESENIVWHSYLFGDADNLYFECTSYDMDDVERQARFKAKISNEYTGEICELIEALS